MGLKSKSFRWVASTYILAITFLSSGILQLCHGISYSYPNCYQQLGFDMWPVIQSDCPLFLKHLLVYAFSSRKHHSVDLSSFYSASTSPNVFFIHYVKHPWWKVDNGLRNNFSQVSWHGCGCCSFFSWIWKPCRGLIAVSATTLNNQELLFAPSISQAESKQAEVLQSNTIYLYTSQKTAIQSFFSHSSSYQSTQSGELTSSHGMLEALRAVIQPPPFKDETAWTTLYQVQLEIRRGFVI